MKNISLMSQIKKQPLEYLQHLSNLNKAKPGPTEQQVHHQEREDNFQLYFNSSNSQVRCQSPTLARSVSRKKWEEPQTPKIFTASKNINSEQISIDFTKSCGDFNGKAANNDSVRAMTQQIAFKPRKAPAGTKSGKVTKTAPKISDDALLKRIKDLDAENRVQLEKYLIQLETKQNTKY